MGDTSKKSTFENELKLIHAIRKGWRLEVPTHVKDLRFWERALAFQFIYSLTGLLGGLLSTFGGVVLFLNGIYGSSSWTAKFIGFNSNISDAAPGSILFIVGLFIIWATKYAVVIKK